MFVNICFLGEIDLNRQLDICFSGEKSIRAHLKLLCYIVRPEFIIVSPHLDEGRL